MHTKDRKTEKDDNSSDSILLISDTDRETDRHGVQASPVKSVIQDSDIITISSVSDSSPVKLNKTPESYLGDKLKLKKQTKSPSEKGVKNKVSPKTRKRTAAMISDSEDEVVIRISKRRKHTVARSRLDVSDSPESETNDLSDSVDGDREARNLKGPVKSKVKKHVYSFDSKSSSTDFEIKTFKSRKRKMSRDSNKSGSGSTSLCSTPMKSEDETLVKSTSSSESGDTPAKGPRKRRKSLESLLKSRHKKKVSNPIEKERSDFEQDSDTGHMPGRLETNKTKKFGKRKIETKKEVEHFETDESDTPVDSEDETLSKLRQNRSKNSKNLKLKPTVVKTDSSGESDEEITAKPTKFSKNAKGTKGKKDSFNKTENRKTSKQSSSDSSKGSEMSEDDDKISTSSKSKKRVGPLTNDEESDSDSGLDSDNSEDIPLAKLNTSCDRQKVCYMMKRHIEKACHKLDLNSHAYTSLHMYKRELHYLRMKRRFEKKALSHCMNFR